MKNNSYIIFFTHRLTSENNAPGERPVFVGVREQRMTTLIMSILIGLSVFLNFILRFIPMAVLYGVFLFMGVSALRGLQFYQRLLILFMPTKHQPDVLYLRHVSLKRVHLFTLIQLVSAAGLYLIKFIESVAITFPILVLATCGVRKLLDFVFSQRELFWLDDILPSKKKNPVVNHNNQEEEDDDDTQHNNNQLRLRQHNSSADDVEKQRLNAVKSNKSSVS